MAEDQLSFSSAGLDPTEGERYRSDLASVLGHQKVFGTKAPETLKMPEAPFDVVLSDPDSPQFSDVIKRPEYKDSSWYKVPEEDQLFPGALLVSQGKLDDKKISEIPSEWQPTPIPATAEDKLSAVRQGFEATPVSKYLDNPKVVFDQSIGPYSTSYNDMPSRPDGTRMGSLELLMLPSLSEDRTVGQQLVDQGILSAYTVGIGHHIDLSPESRSEVAWGTEFGDDVSFGGVERSLYYYPKGLEETKYRLPLSHSDARALFVEDWAKHAEPAFIHLENNDYQLDAEATNALGHLSILAGKETGLKIAEALVSNDFEAIEKLLRSFDYSKSISGSRIQAPLNQKVLSRYINSLSNSWLYNKY